MSTDVHNVFDTEVFWTPFPHREKINSLHSKAYAEVVGSQRTLRLKLIYFELLGGWK